MTIHSFDATADTTAADTAWAQQESMPTAEPDALEQVMAVDGKIYVAVVVLLIVWVGIMVYIYRTDRKIDTLEQRLEQKTSNDV